VELLTKVKQNLMVEHEEDDLLIQSYITAATAYAEGYQKKTEGYYRDNQMDPITEQAVIMLSSHFYESRDGSTGGFFADKVDASEQVWNVVNLLLRMNKEVVI
jgi:Phage gp6-like head-tail connector protein